MVSLTFPQANVKVNLDFYDAIEKSKLTSATYPPTAVAQMTMLCGTDIDVPTSEFLSYYLFHKKLIGTEGYTSYRAVGEKLGTALAHLDGCIEFNGNSISTPKAAKHQLNEVSEHIGEAVGLAVISRIHKLHEADWEPIPIQGGRKGIPTHDFQVASDMYRLIQVENKGSSVVDNSQKNSAISGHKKVIHDKKLKLKNLPVGTRDLYPANVRYGTITAVDAIAAHNVKCWLLDPPPDNIDSSPKNFRLLQRMRFLRAWLSVLKPRSQIVSALSTRLADLENLANPFVLDKIPLSLGGGKPFNVYGEDPYYMTKSRISFEKNSENNQSKTPDIIDDDGEIRFRYQVESAFGATVQISDDALMFLGIEDRLLTMIAVQDFDEICSYGFEPITSFEKVRCVVSAGRARSMELPESLRIDDRMPVGYASFELSGSLHCSGAGLVFGVLPITGD